MIRKYTEIFCWKNVSSFCIAKATHIFSAKNIKIMYIESAKTVNEMTLNELVKLTTLWTTGPWCARKQTIISNKKTVSDNRSWTVGTYSKLNIANYLVELIWLIWLCWGLTTRQPLRVILCRLPEKGRKEIEEIEEEMKERDREERGTGKKVKKQKK